MITVNFFGRDGGFFRGFECAIGEKLVAPSPDFIEHFGFLGWFATADNGAEIVLQGGDLLDVKMFGKRYLLGSGDLWSPLVTSDGKRLATHCEAGLDFFAKYERTEYNVRYFMHNGAMFCDSWIKRGENATPPAPLDRVGFAFDKWDVSLDQFLNIQADFDVLAIYRPLVDYRKIKLYIGDTLVNSIDKVVNLNLRDSLNGEVTLEFTAFLSGANVFVNQIATFEDYVFNVVRSSKQIQGNFMVCTAFCEHVSYCLNNDEYKIKEFDYSGSAIGCLEMLLADTLLVVGVVDFSQSVILKINREVTRRAALMQLVAILQCELEYDGYRVNLRRRRGSSTVVELLKSKNVTDISTMSDTRSNTITYDVQLFKKQTLHVGDTVKINFPPLNIFTTTRIIELEYNPFDAYNVRVEIGDYRPVFDPNMYSPPEIREELEDLKDNLDEFDFNLKDLQDTLNKTKEDVVKVEKDQEQHTIWESELNEVVEEMIIYQWDINDDLNKLKNDFDNAKNNGGFREPINLVIEATSFLVSYSNGNEVAYNYSLAGDGRISSISKKPK